MAARSEMTMTYPTKRETTKKFFDMTISSSKKNIQSPLPTPTPGENEALSHDGERLAYFFKQALEADTLDIRAIPLRPPSPIDYEADLAACQKEYEELLKKLYECEDWPTGPDCLSREEWALYRTMPSYPCAYTGPSRPLKKANKQLSFIPPSLSESSEPSLSIKPKGENESSDDGDDFDEMFEQCYREMDMSFEDYENMKFASPSPSSHIDYEADIAACQPYYEKMVNRGKRKKKSCIASNGK